MMYTDHSDVSHHDSYDDHTDKPYDPLSYKNSTWAINQYLHEESVFRRPPCEGWPGIDTRESVTWDKRLQ